MAEPQARPPASDRGRSIDGPTIIPCRDPTNGIRRALHLITPRRCSSARQMRPERA